MYLNPLDDEELRLADGMPPAADPMEPAEQQPPPERRPLVDPAYKADALYESSPESSYSLGGSLGPLAGKLQERLTGRRDYGDIDFLGAIAAWTKNPALMQMWQAKRQDAQYAREQPAREAEAQRRDAAERRTQEKHDWELGALGDAKADKMRADTSLTKAKAQAAMQGMDPNSPYVQTLKDGIVAGLESQAVAIERVQPQYAELLRAKAKGIMRNRSLTADQLKDLTKDGIIGNLVKPILQQSHNQALEAIASGQLGLGWSRANEQARHNRAMEDQGGMKIDAKVQGNQEKLNEKIEGLNNAEELLDQASEAKKNVDVGPIATPINKLRQYTPWPNKDFDQLQQSLGSVRNEIKLLKAGKAVTANEEKGLNEELANLEQLQNDPTFEAKLQGMRSRLAGYKRRAVNQYQRKGGGETVDRSNTARESTKSAPSLTPGEQAQPAPHGQRVRQNGRVFEWNGTKYVEVQ